MEDGEQEANIAGYIVGWFTTITPPLTCPTASKGAFVVTTHMYCKQQSLNGTHQLLLPACFLLFSLCLPSPHFFKLLLQILKEEPSNVCTISTCRGEYCPYDIPECTA